MVLDEHLFLKRSSPLGLRPTQSSRAIPPSLVNSGELIINFSPYAKARQSRAAYANIINCAINNIIERIPSEPLFSKRESAFCQNL